MDSVGAFGVCTLQLHCRPMNGLPFRFAEHAIIGNRELCRRGPMKSYVFKVAVEPDKFEDGRDAWHASCPALKGCHTWGHTREEALANLREAIDLYVQDLLEAGELVPVGQGTIELPEPAVVVNV